ncbi:hypothetical protein CXG50_15780 [Pseudomonas plecoglossicida]|nr:hypothetical protein CSW00_17580 [Pseudomonas sp. MR 02]PLP92692.1 hypothetical protein CX682_06780 [Pseudomonas sp. FFUP_PS_41]PLU92255.1 hypothetical protein CXG52_25050 [Pseudomonas plecoglossicida]QKK97558.1 hypothetical protein GEV38_16975 [Pseudomonas sp. 13159349]TXI08473.1 MAG: hypothetical protein E6Q70_02685 [Pseudomonas monteilii]
MSRKGCKAAPAICAPALKPWGCCAALSRHKAAPTQILRQLSSFSISAVSAPGTPWPARYAAG